MEHRGGSTSRARRVLDLVLEDHERAFTHVAKSWTEGPDVLCLVYTQPDWYGDLVLGLRRQVESDWTVEGVADEILICELGEPLGSHYETLESDAAGVMWWTGNLPEWKRRR